MSSRSMYRLVRSYIAAAAVIFTASMLVFAIYFTELGMQWVTFLTGVLIASILAVATRASQTEWRAAQSDWILTRRTAQLAAVKNKLENEKTMRINAEQQIASCSARLSLIDDSLPNILALVDTNLCFQYNNRAFRNWVSMQKEQINGQTMRKVLGHDIYSDMENGVRQSLIGNAVKYTLFQRTQSGTSRCLSVEHFPQFSQNGKVTGFYISLIEIANNPAPTLDHNAGDTSKGVMSEQDMYIDSFNEQFSGHKDAVSRIMAAINKDEFHLFCQTIIPISTTAGNVTHYEILIRLLGDEDSMMPPGAFFPLAEKHGLMKHLDRWVVQHITEWISNKKIQGVELKGSIFFINISNDSIQDSEFPAFLKQQLQKYDVLGTALCFEIGGSSAIANLDAAAKFAQQVRECGCTVALCDFGQDGVSFELLRKLRVDFLKIDGSIILHILQDPIYLAKVKAICQVTSKIGVKTIAELVENEDIIAKLKVSGVDSAQGFGISRPISITQI